MSKVTTNIITAAILVSGISFLFVGSSARLQGYSSGPGATLPVVQQQAQSVSILKPAAFQYMVHQSIGPELALGMLLVLLGMTVHVFFILRKQPLSSNGAVQSLSFLRISILRSRNHRRN